MTAGIPYPSEMELSVGKSGSVSLGFSPGSAEGQSLIWVSSNNSVATVENGVISAVGEGQCTVTVALENQPDVSADIAVTVSPEDESPDADVSEADHAFNYISPEQVYPNCYLAENEVAGMDLDTIQFYINTLYAKNGYIFQTPSIAAYFEMQPWYSPVTGDANVIRGSFSAMDNANLALLVKYRSNKNPDNSYNTAVIGSLWTWRYANEKLSKEFVASLSKYDVQLMIDTIYAKNGYIFQTQEIQALFETQSWYYGWTSNAYDLSFSVEDQANLALLVKYR